MKLTLVGAGPGDPELITLKGLNAIKNAKVILYDALANTELLKYASENCTKIYVGKKANCHSLSQHEINTLIVETARKYGNVVRLKGGDPIVFGRASEELEFAEIYGIETEVISGISSCIAAPTYSGIPITKRGIAESFWVLTGHTKNNGLPADIHLAAQSNATVVILMGLAKLEAICEIFKKYGKAKMSVAVIQNGTKENQTCILGKIDDVVLKMKNQHSKDPGVIIIGEVVKTHKEYFQIYAETILN